MSRSVLSVVAIAMGAIVLDAGSAFAKTVAVGPKECLPAQQHFTTIQAAVDHLATVLADNTINVCPGTYPEQITVSSTTLTIKGVANGTGALSLITIPPGGLKPNVESSLGSVAAQIGFSPKTGPIFGSKLINLTIDGTGGTCGDAKRAAGIAYVDVGDVTFSTFGGTMQNVVVRNQMGCAADGILSDNSFISITGSVVHDVSENCIHQIGGDININNNTIQICNQSGIVLDGTRDATVTNNVLSNNQYGIRLNKTTDCTVSGNTIGPWVGTGVYVVDGTNTGVVSNKIKSSWAGIWLVGNSGAMVRLNSIHRTSVFALAHVYSTGNNQFTSNTMSEGRFGIYAYNPVAVTVPDLMEPNTFLNIKQTLTADPWVPE